MAIYSISTLVVLAIFVLFSSMKVVKEYERGVKFTLGKFSGMMSPGLRLVIPALQTW